MSKLRLPKSYSDTVQIPNSALQVWWEANGVRDALEVRKRFRLSEGFVFWDHKAVEKAFGLSGWQFGNWTNQEDRFNYVVATGVSLLHLSQALGVSRGRIGKKVLSIGIGVRGLPRSRASFFPAMSQINLNRWPVKRAGEMFRVKREGKGYEEAISKTGGAGSLAHEYGHFIDRLVASMHGNTMAFYTGNKGQFKPDLGGRNWIVGDKVRKVFQTIYYEKDGKPTAFHKLMLEEKFEGYWRSNVEVWARTFEKCIGLYLADNKIPNYFLAKERYAGGIYPSDAICRKVWPLIREISRAALK